MQVLLINLIALLGLTGFLISAYIYNKKKAKKKLICPRRSNCETVIHSDYSKVLGIPVEVMGMIYYAFIGSIYSFGFNFNFWSPTIASIVFGITACSVLFSVYLVSIQTFVLKHWCMWCLCSALTSILIFVSSYIHLISY